MIGILLFMVNVTVKSNCSKSHSQLHQIQVKNWRFQNFFPKIPTINCRNRPIFGQKWIKNDRQLENDLSSAVFEGFLSAAWTSATFEFGNLRKKLLKEKFESHHRPVSPPQTDCNK